MKLGLCAALVCAATQAFAHSASDAYLTLTVARDARIEAQWDVALRDLNFAVGLDDDGDGNLTWGEVKKHAAQIERYAYDRLRAQGDGKPCALKPSRHAVSQHADGAYLALFFDVVCGGAPRVITLDYDLFFTIDPSHRGIVVLRAGKAASTALASPDKPRLEFALPPL
jgi:hypothetical protein